MVADWENPAFNKSNLIDANDPQPFLFLPAAGYRSSFSAGTVNVGSLGWYWSSTTQGTNAHLLDLSSTSVKTQALYRTLGNSVRCVSDNGEDGGEEEEPSGNFWSLEGNAGTNPAVNKLGTTDNQPIIVIHNDKPIMRIGR